MTTFEVGDPNIDRLLGIYTVMTEQKCECRTLFANSCNITNRDVVISGSELGDNPWQVRAMTLRAALRAHQPERVTVKI